LAAAQHSQLDKQAVTTTHQKDSPMSQLDEALVELRQDMDDPKRQSKYYDLFMNSTFYVPTMKPEPQPDGPDDAEKGEQVMPLVMESEGNDYLMLFDSVERLNAWAKEETSYVEVPGHFLAVTSAPPLHWALNVETEFAKPFIPAEIAWLKEVVEQCQAAAEKPQE
jgi:hypothetical protein